MADTRDEYLEKLKAKMDQWNAELSRLEAKANEVEADAKIEYKTQLEKLRTRKMELQQKIDELRNTSGDAWQDVKAGIENAWQEFGESVKSATARFR